MSSTETQSTTDVAPSPSDEAVEGSGAPNVPATTERPMTSPPPAEAPAVAAAVDAAAQLGEERDRLRDQLLRVRADFDNFRKRARRDEVDATRRGKEEVLRELLPVFDNLERAANYAKVATDAKAIGDGVVMVLRLFADSLTRLGGQRLEAVGSVFDPNVHEAIQQMESDKHPAGVVLTEFVPGYNFGDRLLRAAQVVVSKGPGPTVDAVEVIDAVEVVDADETNEAN